MTLWVLFIAVPFVLQAIAGNVLAPPLKVTWLHWLLYDAGVPMHYAYGFVDVFWRTAEAAVGLVVAPFCLPTLRCLPESPR